MDLLYLAAEAAQQYRDSASTCRSLASSLIRLQSLGKTLVLGARGFGTAGRL